jgi:hypothetical protein
MKRKYTDHNKLFDDLEEKFSKKNLPKPISKSEKIGFGLKIDIGVEYDENIVEELEQFANLELQAAVKNNLEKIKGPLTEALNQSMQASWGWTEGARDIVDTGELMKSLKIEINGTNISITYDSPYAMLVHYGGYIMPYGNNSIERIYVPGRPWIDAVLNGGGPVPQFNFEDYIEIQ